jgi:hypothetical protein
MHRILLHSVHNRDPQALQRAPEKLLAFSVGGAPGERECCLLVLNLVSSTLPCIRQPRPRLRVLDVCGFV